MNGTRRATLHRDVGFAVAQAIREDRQFVARSGREVVAVMRAELTEENPDVALCLRSFERFLDIVDGKCLPPVGGGGG